MAPAVLQGAAGVAAYVGGGRLGPKATRPALILISESGGSGGCVQIDMAVPEGRAYRSVRLSASPVDHGTICNVEPERLNWPSDITGHGRPEFLLKDSRFHCAFTSCAGSWYPPRVIAFDGRRGVDVSDDPSLAPLYRRDMLAAKAACERRITEAQGPCAGYAADAARLGRLKQALSLIWVQVRRGCRATGYTVCPDVYRIPKGFPAKLSAMLRNSGYGAGGRFERASKLRD